MKRFLFISIVCLVSFVPLRSQHLEVGATVGASNYLGDLAPSGLWTSLGEMNFSGGAFVRYNAIEWVTIRAGLNYAKVSASDAKANSSTGSSRTLRNLSFRSNVYEFHLTGEINIMGYQPYNLYKPFSPYVFGGIAVFKFNPQTLYEGSWYNLQPLGTEGQGLPDNAGKYKLTEFSIPFGAGVKYAINDTWNIGLEIGMRKLFTDYLDDVSTSYPDLASLEAVNGPIAAELSWRGDEVDADATPPNAGTGRGDVTDKDWYTISGITVSYNFLDNGLVGSRRRSGRKSGCPSF